MSEIDFIGYSAFVEPWHGGPPDVVLRNKLAGVRGFPQSVWSELNIANSEMHAIVPDALKFRLFGALLLDLAVI